MCHLVVLVHPRPHAMKQEEEVAQQGEEAEAAEAEEAQQGEAEEEAARHEPASRSGP